MQWTKAIPEYDAFWAVDGTCPESCQAEQRRTCDACTKSKQWFLTANGYAVSLSRMKDRIRHQQARSIFRGLWDSRTRLPDVLPATHLAKSYLAVFLALNDDLQAKTVGQEAWTAAKQERTDWEINETILCIGEYYAEAPDKNNKPMESKGVYEAVFAARKRLSDLDRNDGPTRVRAIKCGRALLTVAKKRRYPNRCREVKYQISALENNDARREQSTILFAAHSRVA
jgi:hypothetical protein